MDPNACYKRLREAVSAEEWDDVVEHARNLREWISHGGFVPNRLDWMHATTSRAQWLDYCRSLIVAALGSMSPEDREMWDREALLAECV